MFLRPIRIVLVVEDLGFGGAERQVVRLAKHMDRGSFRLPYMCAFRSCPP